MTEKKRLYGKDRRHLFKTMGWCINHKGVPPLPGRSRCLTCMERRRAKYSLQDERKREAVRNGFCRIHHKMKVRSGKSLCSVCRRRKSKQDKERMDKLKEEFNCVSHKSEPVAPGHIRCYRCLERRAEQDANRKAKLREGGECTQ